MSTIESDILRLNSLAMGTLDAQELGVEEQRKVSSWRCRLSPDELATDVLSFVCGGPRIVPERSTRRAYANWGNLFDWLVFKGHTHDSPAMLRLFESAILRGAEESVVSHLLAHADAGYLLQTLEQTSYDRIEVATILAQGIAVMAENPEHTQTPPFLQALLAFTGGFDVQSATPLEDGRKFRTGKIWPRSELGVLAHAAEQRCIVDDDLLVLGQHLDQLSADELEPCLHHEHALNAFTRALIAADSDHLAVVKARLIAIVDEQKGAHGWSSHNSTVALLQERDPGFVRDWIERRICAWVGYRGGSEALIAAAAGYFRSSIEAPALFASLRHKVAAADYGDLSKGWSSAAGFDDLLVHADHFAPDILDKMWRLGLQLDPVRTIRRRVACSFQPSVRRMSTLPSDEEWASFHLDSQLEAEVLVALVGLKGSDSSMIDACRARFVRLMADEPDATLEAVARSPKLAQPWAWNLAWTCDADATLPRLLQSAATTPPLFALCCRLWTGSAAAAVAVRALLGVKKAATRRFAVRLLSRISNAGADETLRKMRESEKNKGVIKELDAHFGVGLSAGELILRSLERGDTDSPLRDVSLADKWMAIEVWTKEHCPGLRKSLKRGAKPRSIKAIVDLLGEDLPADLAGFFASHDGQSSEAQLFINYHFCTTKELLGSMQTWRKLMSAPVHGELAESMSSEPPLAIKPMYANPKWIPVLSDGAGNHIGVDLDPDTEGTRGQIISFGRDEHRKHVLAASWSDFVDGFLSDLVHEVVVSSPSTLSLQDATGYASFVASRGL